MDRDLDSEVARYFSDLLQSDKIFTPRPIAEFDIDVREKFLKQITDSENIYEHILVLLQTLDRLEKEPNNVDIAKEISDFSHLNFIREYFYRQYLKHVIENETLRQDFVENESVCPNANGEYSYEYNKALFNITRREAVLGKLIKSSWSYHDGDDNLTP